MKALESIRFAVKSIINHKLRSILTIVGLIVGVASIIIIVTMGQMAEASLKSQFAGPDGNIVSINYNPFAGEGDTSLIDVNVNESPKISETDIIEIRKSEKVKNLILSNTNTIKLQGQQNEIVQADLLGIEETSFNNKGVEVIKGKNLTPFDFQFGKSSAIISEELESELLGNKVKQEIIGSIINVNGYPVEIAGVYKETNNALSLNSNKMIVSLQLYQNIFKSSSIDTIEVEAFSVEDMESAGKEVVNILNKNKGEQFTGQFEVLNLEEMKKGVSALTNTLTLLIGGIASISLFVAGIGVMNIMLISVTERTKEIGIRKALGATRGLILFQFLIESIMLTLLGGILGIILAYGSISMIALIFDWKVVFSPIIIIAALSFLVILGIIFGIIPANKAAKLKPVEAFRFE